MRATFVGSRERGRGLDKFREKARHRKGHRIYCNSLSLVRLVGQIDTPRNNMALSDRFELTSVGIPRDIELKQEREESPREALT